MTAPPFLDVLEELITTDGPQDVLGRAVPGLLLFG